MINGSPLILSGAGPGIKESKSPTTVPCERSHAWWASLAEFIIVSAIVSSVSLERCLPPSKRRTKRVRNFPFDVRRHRPLATGARRS